MPIDRSEYLLTRVLPDGRVIDVVPLTFARARIILSESVEAVGWSDGY